MAKPEGGGHGRRIILVQRALVRSRLLGARERSKRNCSVPVTVSRPDKRAGDPWRLVSLTGAGDWHCCVPAAMGPPARAIATLKNVARVGLSGLGEVSS